MFQALYGSLRALAILQIAAEIEGRVGSDLIDPN
jgi:hypothetical protein